MAMVMTDVQREQLADSLMRINVKGADVIDASKQQEEEEEAGGDILVLLENEEEFQLSRDSHHDIYYDEESQLGQFNLPHNTDLLVDDDEEEEEEEDEQVEEAEVDEAYYLANRTFYTTCHKISRQNSPSYRKRPPYTFLENWFIHSVFSKSQQILLKFPVIHPKVMMTEGDFIYTPHQMASEDSHQEPGSGEQHYYETDNQGQQMDYDYGDEEEYDYYDDTFIIGDEGVMVMSASAPDASQFMAEDDEDNEESDELHASSIVMDENMWMGHSRYNMNGLTLHVANPDDRSDDEEEEDPMYHNVLSSNNPYKSFNHNNNNSYQGQLQAVKEEDEEEEDEEEDEERDKGEMNNGMYDSSKEDAEGYCSNHHLQLSAHEDSHSMNLSMSPEVLNWYRSADVRPVTLSVPTILDDSNNVLIHPPLAVCDNEQPQQSLAHGVPSHHSVNYGCSSSGSSTSSESSSCSVISNGSQRTDPRSIHSDEKSTAQNSIESYQSLADIMMEEEDIRNMQHTSYGTLLPSHYQSRSLTLTNSNDNTQPKTPSPLMQVSVCLADAAWVALDLAQAYVEDVEGSKGITGFISCMFRIWKVLFLGAETMVGWGSHRLRPQAMV